MVRVEFYGVLTEAVGRSALNVEYTAPGTVADLLARLAGEWPALAEHLPRVACAVDDEIVHRAHSLSPGMTVALLPPVSGG